MSNALLEGRVPRLKLVLQGYVSRILINDVSVPIFAFLEKRD